MVTVVLDHLHHTQGETALNDTHTQSPITSNLSQTILPQIIEHDKTKLYVKRESARRKTEPTNFRVFF